MQLWEAQHARAEANLKFDDGDLPGARDALDALIGRLRNVADLPGFELARAHVDRATVARFSNDWDGALADLDAAESLAGSLPLLGRRPVVMAVHLLRAKIHSTSFSKAFDLARADAALGQLKAAGLDRWVVEELESHIAFQRRDWDRAAAAALSAATLLEQHGWSRGVAACRRRAGEALLELGELERARTQLETALAFLAAQGPPDLLSETRLALARLESRCLNHEIAWSLAANALAEVESRVRRFIDLGEQQRFLLDKLRFFDHAFDIGLARGAGAGWLRAWTVAERSKSFYLAHLLANADVPLFAGVAPDLERALASLERALDACERRVEILRNAGGSDADEAKLGSEVRALSEERAATLKQIVQANPRWAALRSPGAFDAARLIQSLPADVTPLSYFWRDSSPGATLHMFARTADGKPLHTAVAWQREHLEALAKHAECLHGAVDEYGPLFPEGMTERVLPPDFRQQLASESCLLISPHGRLKGLPLHALPLDDSIVIARWPVQYVPSFGLPSRPTGTPAAGVLLMGSPLNAFGDAPLPDVELELQDLQEVWRKVARPLVRKLIAMDEGPDDVGWPPRTWSEFDVLHFACHGRFFDGRPLDSALRLGHDAVRGTELFATKLNARVVSLSACALGQRAETYGDTEVVSEEWVGLYLPLFYAGARALVVSLWDANSRVARDFMVAFHGAVAAGEKPHLAFRTATLSVQYRLPARWANWCLVGVASHTE